MKSFQDYLRNNMNIYADACDVINMVVDENDFVGLVNIIYSTVLICTKCIDSHQSILKVLGKM